MTQQEADQLAEAWIAAWDSHHLETILAHYTEDVEFTSPFAVRLMGREDGVVRGKEELREYFSRGLAAYPDLRFHLYRAAPGVGSLVLHYRSVNNLEAMEVMELAAGRARRVLAHYCAADRKE